MDREKKLTNLSQWRQLNESDFQQYLASSDSEDDEEADDSRLRINSDGSIENIKPLSLSPHVPGKRTSGNFSSAISLTTMMQKMVEIMMISLRTKTAAAEMKVHRWHSFPKTTTTMTITITRAK